MTDNKLKHVTFIMDGNGRWAKNQGKPRVYGHHQGAQRFKDIVYASAEIGIPYVSFYAFSKENWKRPQEEVDVIMGLWKIYMKGEIGRLQDRNIRVRVLGDRSDLSKDLVQEIERTEEATEDCTGTQALVFISYSGRWELLNAVKNIHQQVKNGELSLDEVDEACMDSHLVTAGIPEPDLLIRTSGEQRISNYLLWQLSYSEFSFVPQSWPDFTPEVLQQCVEDYYHRERRFGDVSSA